MASSQSVKKGQNKNIARERSQVTFDPTELTYFLYDGRDRFSRKRFIQNIAIQDLKNGDFERTFELSREETYEEAMRKSIFLMKRYHELDLTDARDRQWYKEVFFPSETSPLDLHTDMFTPTISRLGTKEQVDKWVSLAQVLGIVGTYAQTELGHGTFLRGLETTATYDRATKEFIMDSPTITSTKFWPGSLGKTTNFCIVMAKLIIDDRNHGMQSFMVQLRDLETHRPLPGITVGDIGAKFGFHGTDNGFLRLDKVRIPRDYMLMRYAQVLEDGTFVQPKNNHLIYGTMTQLRIYLADSCSTTLSKVVTIATRYSAVRLQSEIDPGMGEVAVLNFQTQQHKLFVQLATAYAFIVACKRCVSFHEKVSSQIEEGNYRLLPELHAISSAMKAFTSWAMAHGIEQCRFACGGHGYLMASGIPKIYMSEVAVCTAEGENTVLLLQTARYLNKCFEARQRGESVPQSTRFLSNTERRSKLTVKFELDHLCTAFEYRVAILMKEANKRMKTLIQRGMKPAEAWNNSSQALLEAATAYCHSYVVSTFAEAVHTSNLSPSARKVMVKLCQLYAAYGITKNAGHFVKGGFMSIDQIDMVQSKIYDLLAEIRPNAVALVDVFDFPDEVLDSALGRHDGNVYEALMESARNSKLNQTEVHEGIFKYVKPYVQHLKQQKELKSRL